MASGEVKVYLAVNFYKINFWTDKVYLIGTSSENDKSYTISEIVEVDPNVAPGCTAATKKHLGYCIGDFNYQHVHDSFKQIFSTLREAIDFIVKRDNL